MKTIVIQSFRSRNVPRYVTECCASVETWARAAGYSYQFLDDAFLQLAPEWYRHKAGPYLCVVTDLARLIQVQRLLMAGWDRVVWCDADMIVFRPSLLVLEPHWTGTYCKEVWLYKDELGRPGALLKVNNSMCVFTSAGMEHLAEYIHQCYEMVQHAPSIVSQLSVGTDLLTSVHPARGLIAGVATVGPVLMEAILESDSAMLSRYLEWQGAPICAANLCNTRRQGFGDCPKLYDYLCAGVIESLRSGAPGQLLSAA